MVKFMFVKYDARAPVCVCVCVCELSSIGCPSMSMTSAYYLRVNVASVQDAAPWI